MEGEAEDEHDEAGRGREGDGEGGERAPGGKRGVARLHHRDVAERRLQHAHGGQRAAVVGEGDFQHAGTGTEGGERLAGAEHVDQASADGGVGAGRGGDDHAVLVGQQKAAAIDGGPGRQRLRQQVLRPRVGVLAESGRLLQALGGDIGNGIKRDHHVAQSLPAVLQQLHGGADADGGQEGDDENGNSAAEQGLRGQQPPVSRLGDRLRETLDGIGMCRRTRQAGARHGRPPLGIPLITLETEGCAASLRITFDWNRWPLICRESEINYLKSVTHK